MAFFFTMAHDHDTYNGLSSAHESAYVGALVCIIGFPSALLMTCMFAVPKILRDRAAREAAGPQWVECGSYQHQCLFYYNTETEDVTWSRPVDLDPEYCNKNGNSSRLSALPWESRSGLETVFSELHCNNLVSQFYPVLELGDVMINVAMVSTYFWKGNARSAWALAIAKGVHALLTTVGLPYIDTSDSQRNVDNWAGAVSLWLLSGSMLFLCVDMQNSETEASDEGLVYGFMILASSAMLVGPIASLIDQKLTPSETK